jgi:enamine deaminase RidA (YjgF/YER057c/UK114 family)
MFIWQIGLSMLLVLNLSRSGGAAAAEPPIRCIRPSATAGSSLAVIVGRTPLAHTAQILPLDRDGQIVGLNEQVFKNLSAALAAAKGGLDQVIKLNVYSANDRVAAQVREALPTVFRGTVKPAVSFVAGQLAHPEALVAMDAVAAVARLQSRDLVAPREALSHVALLPPGGKVYVSGQAEKGNDLRLATRATLESLQRMSHHELVHTMRRSPMSHPMARELLQTGRQKLAGNSPNTHPSRLI